MQMVLNEQKTELVFHSLQEALRQRRRRNDNQPNHIATHGQFLELLMSYITLITVALHEYVGLKRSLCVCLCQWPVWGTKP